MPLIVGPIKLEDDIATKSRLKPLLLIFTSVDFVIRHLCDGKWIPPPSLRLSSLHPGADSGLIKDPVVQWLIK